MEIGQEFRHNGILYKIERIGSKSVWLSFVIRTRVTVWKRIETVKRMLEG